MSNTTIEILSLGASLAALLGTVIVVDWPLIRAFIRRWYFHLSEDERFVIAQDEAEYQAAAMQMQAEHKAAHPTDGLPYDITEPMPLPEPWEVAE